MRHHLFGMIAAVLRRIFGAAPGICGRANYMLSQMARANYNAADGLVAFGAEVPPYEFRIFRVEQNGVPGDSMLQ